MGQQKGNPIPSYQNQGYEALYPNTNARENRDYGTKPVMIDDDRNLNELIDSSSWQFTSGYAKDTDLTDGSINARFNTLTANEYHVTILTSSILLASGSNKFGNTSDDIHSFIGTTVVTGSLIVSGSDTILSIGKVIVTGSFLVTGSTTQTGNNTLIGNTIQTGNNTLIGDTVLSGSIEISGSVTGSLQIDGDLNLASPHSFYRWGNKLFNYGQWACLETQSGSANTAYAFKLISQEGSVDGVSVQNNQNGFPTRITVDNTGVYNLQFSAQLANTANTNIAFDIWFAYTGSNMANTNTQIDVNKSAGQLGRAVAAWNLLIPIQANDYVEILWSCNAGTGQIAYNAPQSTPTRPAVPSVIATITQIA